MSGGTIWVGKAEGGAVSWKVKGEDAVTQNCSKRGLFLLEIGRKGSFLAKNRLGVQRLSSPFDRFSFAPAPSCFFLVITIVRPGTVILCNR